MTSRLENSAIDWSKFKYMVYDLPAHQGNYAERYADLGKRYHTIFRPRVA